MENSQDYKFIIIYDDKAKNYQIAGFVKVNDKWSQDGATTYEYSLVKVLDKIKESKINTFGREAR